MKRRLPLLNPAEAIRVLERNGFRLLRTIKRKGLYPRDAQGPNGTTDG
jgi:hypothetical protein